MKIGIGITTTPRRNVYDEFIWNALLPIGSETIVVCDDRYEGVAASKNKCLKYLYENDCTDIFLFDDDCVPIINDWWKPYVEHPEQHLMYQFKLPSKPAKDMLELFRNEKTVAYSHTRGAMLYIERRVLDVVGGFDTRYINGFEHPDWTNRIFNAGLTTFRAMDVPNSHELFYCLDQDREIESSIPRNHANRMKNLAIYRESKNSREYKEFR